MNPLTILKKSRSSRSEFNMPFLCNDIGWAGDSYSYNGQFLNSYKRTFQEKIHEACHWYVAAPIQRIYPEFGLGANAETGLIKEANSFRFVSLDDCWAQEEEASLLQILIMRELGMVYHRTLDAHGWLDLVQLKYKPKAAKSQFVKDVNPVLKRLLKKKLINKRMKVLI